MMTLFNLIFLLGIIILSTTLLGQCNGFTVPQANLVATKYGARRPMEVVATTSSSETMAKTSSWMLSSSRTTILNAHYASSAASSDDDNSNHDDRTIRDKLRKLTGFSLTAFRATARAATGISLTAVYASTLAVTGLWVRSIMSVILSIFPAWVRFFLFTCLVNKAEDCVTCNIQRLKFIAQETYFFDSGSQLVVLLSPLSRKLPKLILTAVSIFFATILSVVLCPTIYYSRIDRTIQKSCSEKT